MRLIAVHDVRRHSLVVAQFLRRRRERLAPSAQEMQAHSRRRVTGLTRAEVAARAGVSATWYRWLEMGRDVRATPTTLRSIARALELDVDETAYLLLLADDVHPGLPLGQTGDIDDVTLARLVDGFRDGPAFVVNRRWNVVASNGAAREIYGFIPSAEIEQNVVCRLLHDPALREVHQDPGVLAESVISLIRYNYADDPDSEELAQLVNALAGDDRFARAWERCSVRVFAPMPVSIRRNGMTQRFIFIALSVGRRGRETLVVHLPQ